MPTIRLNAQNEDDKKPNLHKAFLREDWAAPLRGVQYEKERIYFSTPTNSIARNNDVVNIDTPLS